MEDAAEQLLLYADLVREFAPGKTLRLDLVVLTKTRQPAIDCHSLPAETAQIDRTKQVVGHVWRAMEAEQFYPAPSPLACSGCPFRQPCRQWPD